MTFIYFINHKLIYLKMNSAVLSLRIRSPSGQHKFDLKSDSNINQLVFEILTCEGKVKNMAEIMEYHKNSISIKKGFPPKPVHLKDFGEQESISSLGLKNNDNLIIEIDEAVLA